MKKYNDTKILKSISKIEEKIKEEQQKKEQNKYMALYYLGRMEAFTDVINMLNECIEKD